MLRKRYDYNYHNMYLIYIVMEKFTRMKNSGESAPSLADPLSEYHKTHNPLSCCNNFN